MLTVLCFLGNFYAFCIEVSHFGIAWEAARNAARCGYDRDTRAQRVNEVLGLKLTELGVKTEYLIKRHRDLTIWEAVKLTGVQLRAAHRMNLAGWSDERFERLLHRIIDDAEAEVAGATERA